MTKWQKAPFTEVIDFQEGPGILSKDFRNSGVPLVRLSGLDAGASVINGCNYLDAEMVAKKWAHFALAEGDILLSTSASLGRVVTVKAEGVGAIAYTGIMRMRPRDSRVHAPYIRYMLESPEFQQQAGVAGGGSVLKHFGPMHLEHMHVHLPALDDQKAIASSLAAIDAKIELNNRINAEVELLAKAIYDYWFVQYNFPDATGRPYKSNGGKMVWNEVLKREIPEGWEVGSLWGIAQYTNGLAMQKYRPEGEEYLPVIKIREMSDGFSSNTERASPSIPVKIIVENGDVLFSWSATLIVQIWSRGRGALNQHIFKVTSKRYPRSFYYFELVNYLQHFKMMAEKRKTTMGHITLDHLRQSLVTIPSLPLIEALDEKLEPMFEHQISLNEQNQELIKLRDWLLPLLMNGQVRVA